MADQTPLPLTERQKDQLRAQNAAISTVLIGRPKPMTDKEWTVLRALGTRRRRPADLVTEGKLPPRSSLPGIHRTAASLVRKGWAKRHKDGGYHGHVSYTVTPAGRKALDDRARQGARDAAAFTRARMKARPHTRVCLACTDPDQFSRHTCGLQRLQAMFPLGGAR